MNATLAFIKISLVIKKLFDRQTADELRDIRAHFADAYSEAQLCALVAVGLICRVFGLVPPQQRGARSMWAIVGLFVQFLKSLSDLSTASRAIPTPLDIMVEDALEDLDLDPIEG